MTASEQIERLRAALRSFAIEETGDGPDPRFQCLLCDADVSADGGAGHGVDCLLGPVTVDPVAGARQLDEILGRLRQVAHDVRAARYQRRGRR